MGRPPAYIFVVRHGKRLDAAERQWHLSSPTPYDPPLTYGGWLQSKTVGTRIASILQEREAEEEAVSNANTTIDNGQHQKKRKKRRYRVLIHSSPFLRCVQSSIAISSGLSSEPFPSVVSTETTTPGLSPLDPQSQTPRGHVASPNHKLTVSTNVASSPHAHAIHKSVLRLDSFLGEWLSPDYFEHITPPPRSMLMLATAKAELLRRENYNEYPHFHTRHSPSATGQLWGARTGSTGTVPRMGSPLVSSVTPDQDMTSSIESLPSLNDNFPPHSHDAAHGGYFHRHPTGHRGYTSPVPSYAISSSQPIPRGYVAHARDACVDVDYQWDSTRDNLGWGDGGVLPEEWASMHQRFRRGLRRLVAWYSTTEDPGEMVTKTPTSATRSSPQTRRQEGPGVDETDDFEVENVVILVSHGAGCNALVGAITQQPVLADVPMSSLTMAQRRERFDDGAQSPEYNRALSPSEDGLASKRVNPSDIFELKWFANTDHLLSGFPRSMAIGRASSVNGPHIGGGGAGGLFSGTYTSALRDVNFGDAYGGSPGGESRRNSANASLGSMRRGSHLPTPAVQPLNYARPSISGGVTVGSGATSLLTHRTHRSGSLGLWQPKQQDPEPNPKDADIPMLLNFSHEKEAAKAKRAEAEEAVIVETEDEHHHPGHYLPTQLQQSATTKSSHNPTDTAATTTTEHPTVSPIISLRKPTDEDARRPDMHSEEHDTFGDADVAVPHLWAGTGNGGLWGAPRPPGEAERLRDFSSTKRRWTVTSGRVASPK